MRKNAKDGSIGDTIVSAFILFLFLAFFSVTVHYVKILSIKQNVDALTREYILIEEQTGELSVSQYKELQDSLTNMGFSNYTITCNGHGLPEANYGEKVNVNVVINTNPHELQISNLFNVFDGGKIKIESVQESISKR